MSLKYYKLETERHPTPATTNLTFRQTKALVRKLFRHWNLPPIPIHLIDKKHKRYHRVESWYQPGEPAIFYHAKMLNLLTVVHEVAHYANDFVKCGMYSSSDRWHDSRHRTMVDIGIKVLTGQWGT